YAFIEPNFGCCSAKMYGSDYTTETPGQYTFGSNPISNNLASPGAWGVTHEYLSPHQLGIAHFNLRTKFLSYTSASGYTAATITNPAFDHIVAGPTGTTEVWSTDRYMKGSVIVPAHKTLSITC